MNKWSVLILFFGLNNLVNAQKESVVLHKNETVNIETNRRGVEIESTIGEKRAIYDSKRVEDYSIKIVYDNFMTVSDIAGNTISEKNRNVYTLYQYHVARGDASGSNVFHSDMKYLFFKMDNVTDNSTINFSYKIRYEEPKLVHPFLFQGNLETKSASITIVCDPEVELGFKLFGDHIDRITFSKTMKGDRTFYQWKAEDLPAFKPEPLMTGAFHYLPHLVYWVKSYKKNGEKIVLLENENSLFAWYSQLVKNINKRGLSTVRGKTMEIVKDAETPFQKAEAIYRWVQENLHYVAMEYEMGGFIPRDAADILEKKYGDCKDMANLLCTMMNEAGITASLTWIGTRSKPYSYHQLPTPSVDNHMITTICIDEKKYFLDATHKYCPFGFPSVGILGKEAMIQIDSNHFSVEQVPIPSAEESVSGFRFWLTSEGEVLKGRAEITKTGYAKEQFLNHVATKRKETENELWKGILSDGNNKMKVLLTSSQKNDQSNAPLTGGYNVELAGWIKSTSSGMILRPILYYPLSNMTIDTGKRKYAVDLMYNEVFNYEYDYELPAGYKTEYLPENVSVIDSIGEFHISYSLENNHLRVIQTVKNKQIVVDRGSFENWQAFIKKLIKNYNQAVLFKKISE